MRLETLGSNQTQITLTNGDKVFFSYNTPVAACIGSKWYRTSKKWSVTTSKHINKWLNGSGAEEMDQSF